MRSAWIENMNAVKNKSRTIDWLNKSQNTFIIHHFAGPACYSTVIDWFYIVLVLLGGFH